MSSGERVLWGTLLGFAAVGGFFLWAGGYWSKLQDALVVLVTQGPTSPTRATRPPVAKGGP